MTPAATRWNNRSLCGDIYIERRKEAACRWVEVMPEFMSQGPHILVWRQACAECNGRLKQNDPTGCAPAHSFHVEPMSQTKQ